MLDIRVLGPVEAWTDRGRLQIGHRQHRFILALLAAEVGRVVTLSTMIDRLWPSGAPPAARNAVQVKVHGLRKAFREHSADDTEPIATCGDGYLLAVPPEWVDAERFRRLVDSAADAHDDRARRDRLAEALAMWRGPAFCGITADEAIRARLAEELEAARLTALEERIAADLRLGGGAELLDELAGATDRYPGSERLVGQHAIALYRAGRPGTALEVIGRYRRRLADELGIDPGRELADVELAVLRAEPDLDPAAGPPPSSTSAAELVVPEPVRPAQLPPEPTAFVGRTSELAELDRMATERRLVLITGPAGVGKTGLAIRQAYRLADRYPDGQLYLDLRGHVTTLPAVEALGGLLRGLGIRPHRIPDDPAAAGALYRSVLAGRRMVIVLDNVADADQVRALLPGGSSCLTLVTGRDRLPGLVAHDGAGRVELSVLDRGDAVELLTRLLPAASGDVGDAGDDRGGLLEALAGECAGLPLALRIAAAQLGDDPHLPLAVYLEQLRTGRLEHLRLDGDDRRGVVAVFDSAYRRLAPAEADMFRLLGLMPAGDVTASAVGALLGISEREARRGLRRLVDRHLVAEHRAGRYRFGHDLLAEYAVRLTRDAATAGESTTSPAAALERLLRWYYEGTVAAGSLLFPAGLRLPAPLPAVGPAAAVPTARASASPVITDRSAALAWFDNEGPGLRGAIESVADGPVEQAGWACVLADAHGHYYENNGSRTEATAVSRAAVHAAERVGDGRATARSLLALAGCYSQTDAQLSLRTLRRACEEVDKLRSGGGEDDPGLRAACLNHLGAGLLLVGDLPAAAERFEAALALRRAAPEWPANAASTLANLSAHAAVVGDLRRAVDLAERAGGVYADADAPGRLAPVLINLAAYRFTLGEVDAATADLRRAGSIAVTTGSHRIELHAGLLRAWIRLELGDHAAALAAASTAVERAGRIQYSSHLAEGLLLAGLARLRSGGDPDLAREEIARSATVADAVGHRRAGLDARVGSAVGQVAAGRLDLARVEAEAVRDDADGSGYILIVADAWNVLADIALADGRPDAAAAAADSALRIFAGSGHRWGRLRAAALLQRSTAS